MRDTHADQLGSNELLGVTSRNQRNPHGHYVVNGRTVA